jgi:hypothetical protein
MNTGNFTFEEIENKAPEKIKRKLEQLECLNERPDYHPEPNTYEHIKIVTNRLIKFGEINLIMAGFYHDICKFDTAKLNPKTGYPTSPGHDKWAEKLILTDEYVQFHLNYFGADKDKVAEICAQHMRIKQINQMKPSKQEKLKNNPVYNYLRIFTMADNMLEDFVVNADMYKLFKGES